MWSLACFGIRGKAINQTKWNHRGNKPLIFTYFTFTVWVTFLDYKRKWVVALRSPVCFVNWQYLLLHQKQQQNLLRMYSDKKEWMELHDGGVSLSVTLKLTLCRTRPSILCHIESIRIKKRKAKRKPNLSVPDVMVADCTAYFARQQQDKQAVPLTLLR